MTRRFRLCRRLAGATACTSSTSSWGNATLRRMTDESDLVFIHPFYHTFMHPRSHPLCLLPDQSAPACSAHGLQHKVSPSPEEVSLQALLGYLFLFLSHEMELTTGQQLVE